MSDLSPMERYRLVFMHEIIDSDGNRHQINEPIICNYCLPISGGCNAVVLNEMIERLRDHLLKQVEERN